MSENPWLKFAPLLILAAALGYLGWPTGDDPSPATQRDSKAKTDASTDRLRPSIELKAIRDPFGSTQPFQFQTASADRASPEGAADASRAAAATAEDTSPPGVADQHEGAGEATASAATDGSSDVQAAASGTIVPSNRAAKVLGELRLFATLLHGPQDLALINDQLLARGDSVVVSSDDEVRLAEVRRDCVLLDLQGESVTLGFSNPPAPPDIVEAAATHSPAAVFPAAEQWRAWGDSLLSTSKQWLKHLPKVSPP